MTVQDLIDLLYDVDESLPVYVDYIETESNDDRLVDVFQVEDDNGKFVVLTNDPNYGDRE